jgi:hypothetical protein
MTEHWASILIAVIAAVPPTIVAYAALKTIRANDARVRAVEKAADEKLGLIHTLVNSNLAKVQTELLKAREELQRINKKFETIVEKSSTV